MGVGGGQAPCGPPPPLVPALVSGTTFWFVDTDTHVQTDTLTTTELSLSRLVIKKLKNVKLISNPSIPRNSRWMDLCEIWFRKCPR